MTDNKKYKGVYGRIDVLLWTDPKFKCLSDDSKIIFLYMLTGPHKNILGFYFLPIPYGAYDLGWDNKRFDKGLHELLDKDLISYDFETSVVFIKNFLKYNPLENPNQVTGAIKAFNVLPPNSVTIEIATCLKRSDKPLLKPLIERLEERLGKPVTVTVTATATATEKGPNKKPKYMRKDTIHYGEFENVYITNAEYEKLIASYGKDVIDSKIEDVSIYIENVEHHKKYTNHYSTILAWLKKDGAKKINEPPEKDNGMNERASDFFASKGILCDIGEIDF